MHRIRFLHILLSLSLFSQMFASANPLPAPVVLSHRRVGTNLTASFPGATTQQLVLEAKSGAGWKPLSVQYGGRGIVTWTSRTTKTGQGTVSFAIPAGHTVDQLRITASPAKFPASRLRGPSTFAGTATPANRVLSPGLVSNVGVMASTSASESKDAPAPLTESDIWKLSGNRLYFFNQYRGLQLFDLANPANPIRTGGLRLPARGEQFFLLDNTGTNLALLGRENTENGSQGVVYIVAVNNGVPSLVTKLQVSGDVIDSRLAGSRLYVTTFEWGWSSGGLAAFSPRITISGFDLSNPRQPVTLPSLPLSGYWPTMQGDNQTLLIAAGSPDDWAQSSLHVIDIATPTGEPKLIKTVKTKGTVADKFKIRVSNGILTAVSNRWNWNQEGNRSATWVENFSARDASTEPLAQLELEEARGESLHATRFDGNKLYVVTFEQVDPLFVVDLSNPTAPAVLGHIEIPGWSTYIEPYGDRLLAVGVEDWKVTVSVFDVADPSKPSLASRVALGENHSWSEAHYDERAAGFFPDQGVLLVPYQTWDNQGWHSATAVVQLDAKGLTLKSSIQHEFTARRAAFTGNHVLSISGQELIVADAKDLSNLEQKAQLSLAWQVDRVLPFGNDHLIQIEDGEEHAGFWGWGVLRAWSPAQRRQTMLRISTASEPDDLIEEIDLGPGRVIGAVERNGYLYLGQYVRETGANASEVIRTWIFDTSKAPELREVSHADSPLTGGASRLNLEQAQALWPDASTLVWHLPAYAFFYGGPILIDEPLVQTTSAAVRSPSVLDTANVTPAVHVTQASSIMVPCLPWRGGSSDITAMLCPVKVGDPKAPTGLPALAIKGLNGAPVRCSSGLPFASAGFVFVSYHEDPNLANSASARNAKSQAWLQVIDFRTSDAPVLRDRVSIPGELSAVADVDHRGAILVTVDSGRNAFRACAYDGISAYQMDVWNSQGEVSAFAPGEGAQILLGRFLQNTHQLSSLRFEPNTGKFRITGSEKLPHGLNEIVVRSGLVLASQWGKVSAVPLLTGGTFGRPVTLGTDANLWIQLGRASVRPNTGVWLPAGAYGVEFLAILAPATGAR
jgi:hypothetical protein